MKNVIIGILSAVFVFSLCSCSKHVDSEKADTVKNESMVMELNQEQFKEKVGDYTGFEFCFVGQHPAIVDFYATWCGPCKALSPIVSEIADEYKDRVDVYRVDIDKNEDVAEAFGIQSVPTLIFFPVNGQPRSSVGLLPKETIKEAIALVLGIK